MKKIRKLQICPSWQRTRLVPQIRLAGNWLRELGFMPGQAVELELAQGRIVLRTRS